MEGLINIQHFGAKIRSRDGLFIVTLPDLSGQGNDRVEEFAPAHIQTILLHPKTSMTVDAILLAHQNGVTCMIIDETGEPIIYFAGSHPSRSLEIWKQQIRLHGTQEGLEYARQWLCTKVRRKIEWLSKLKGYRQDQPDAIREIDLTAVSLQDSLDKLSNLPLHPVSEAAHQLRGIEGNGQKTYLALLNYLLPRQYKFDTRSRQPALDLFNAMLNYGYGILYSWVESALWESGANPYFGFLHSSERDHKALLYDFIEPYRPWVDRVVFKLCVRKIATMQHIETHSKGIGVQLNAGGRKMLATAVFEKFRNKMVAGPNDQQWCLRQAIKKDAVRFTQLVRGLGAAPVATHQHDNSLALTADGLR